MKVIFLDIDGCINRFSPEHSTPVKMVGDIFTQAEPELVYRLNLLVDRTNADLVLSSSWRHFPEWRKSMKASGIIKEFLDRIPLYSDHHKYGIGYDMLCRGHNIQDWLDEHPDVERYAILDDSSEMLMSQAPHFFKTKTSEGLTQAIADAIEKHLSPLP